MIRTRPGGERNFIRWRTYVRITDRIAPFRNPYYHRAEDTSEKIDSGKVARVVDGLGVVITSLATQ